MSPDFNVELEPRFAALSNTYSADRYLFHAMHFIRQRYTCNSGDSIPNWLRMAWGRGALEMSILSPELKVGHCEPRSGAAIFPDGAGCMVGTEPWEIASLRF